MGSSPCLSPFQRLVLFPRMQFHFSLRTVFMAFSYWFCHLHCYCFLLACFPIFVVGSFFKLSSSHIVLTTSPLVSSVFTGLGNSARAACHGLASEHMLEVSFSVLLRQFQSFFWFLFSINRLISLNLSYLFVFKKNPLMSFWQDFTKQHWISMHVVNQPF